MVAAYNLADYGTFKLATTAPLYNTAYTVALNDKTKTTVTAFGTLGTDYTVQWYQDSYSAATDAKNVKCTGTGYDTLTYTPDAKDLGHKLICVATGIGKYSGTVVSDATATVTDAIQSATVSGTAAIGSTLKATAVANSGSGTPTVTYQWYRGSGSTQVAISGATSQTYSPTTADLTYTLYCAVTGTGNFSGTKDTAATLAITAGTVAAEIQNTSGDVPAYGDTLKAVLTPSVAEGSVSYQWYYGDSKVACTTPIVGATSQTFTPQDTTTPAFSYVGKYVGCTITVNASAATSYTAGATAVATGNAVVIGKKMSVSVTNDQRKVSHQTNVEGDILTPTVTSGSATLKYNTDYTVKWYSDNTANELTPSLADTTAANGQYTLTSTDVGHNVYCVITAKGSTYSGTVTSEKFAVTAALSSVTLSSATPTVGTVETVTTAPAGATVSYQWYRVTDNTAKTETAISGATSKTYTVTKADLGYFIKVKATPSGSYTGDAVTATSSSVVAGNALSASDLAVAGPHTNSVVGDTLTATFTLPTTPAGAVASDVTYQWYRSNAADTLCDVSYATKIDGATSATYTLTQADKDAGMAVFVVVSGVSGSYFDGSASIQKGFAYTAGTSSWAAL